MRRALSLAALAMVLAAPSVAHAALKGDVNLDGHVDSADYSVLNQALAGSVTLTWEQRDAADVAPLGTNDLIGNGLVDSADALVFDQALQGNDVDGDGLNVAAETGGTAATNGSPFLRDTDKDGAPDDADSARGSFAANAAPSAPTLAVTAATTTTLSGTVSACSNPDSLPYPSTCTQLIRVVAAGGSCDGEPVVAPVSPTSGAWTVTGLASGVLYTAYARSSDGALTACSSAQTAATTPTGTAAVEPMLLSVTSPTNSNPLNVSGFGAPGQQVRVFVNGVEQDFVRTFATGNPAISPNPFVVPSSGAFTVPVVLDDGVNRISVSAISPGAVESSLSNEVSTKYENVIPRNTVAYPGTPTNPLRILQQPVPDDPNSEEIVAGRILVLTKGDMPGFTNEYYLDHHLEAKANALLVIGAGAPLRFATASGYKRKLIVAGTIRVRGTEENRAVTWVGSLTSTTRDAWGGIEVQSTSRASVIAGLSVRNAGKGIAVTGTVSSRPDLEVRDSSLVYYLPTGIDVSTAGQIAISNTDLDGSGVGIPGCSQTGISIADSTAATLTANYLYSNRYGARLTSTPATVERNGVYSGTCGQSGPTVPDGAGLTVTGAVTTTVRLNDVANTPDHSAAGDWYTGILVENSSPLIESNTIIECMMGIEVFRSGGGSASPTIQYNQEDQIGGGPSGNDPNDTRMHGAVVIRDGAGGTVRWNRFSNLFIPDWGRGVFVKDAGSASIAVTENVFTHFPIGVQIENNAIPSGESISIGGNSFGYIGVAAIRAVQSDVSITDNFVRGAGCWSPGCSTFSAWSAGFFLDATTARVEGNTILDATYAVRLVGGSPEIVGNVISQASQAGVFVKGTTAGTVIQANRIENNTKDSAPELGIGILVANSGAGTAGTIVTIDGGNVISGNAVGIRIEGLANSATGQPVPIIRNNSIYNNAYPLASGPTHNIEIVSYSTPSQATLDFTANWWNSTNQTTITNGIVYLNPPGSGLQPIANIDFPNVVTAPNTNFFAGQADGWVGSELARRAFFVPNLGATPQPVAAIKFYVYDSAASVLLRVCPEIQATCTSANALYSTTGQTFAAGARQIDWNGADSSGKAVVPEAYQYVLEVTKGAVTQIVRSPLADPYVGGTAATPPGKPSTYDGYRNQPIVLKYALQTNGGVDYSAARLVLDVEPRDAEGRPLPEEHFVTGPENYPNGYPIPFGLAVANMPYEVWQARNLDGRIISGETQVTLRSIGMKRQVVIVTGSAPAITSDSGAITLKAEPRLVYDTFEQVAAISYRVDRAADVTIALLPPDSWSDTGAPTWQFTNVPANTTQLFQFRGHEVMGMVGVSAESARNLVTALAQEGAFTFRVRATDPVSTRTAETVVTVQVRH